MVSHHTDNDQLYYNTGTLLLDFDTIDHDNLFCILEKYVGICGNALKLIKSYFSNRTQRVQIDDVLSDLVNIICDVPQGSVLGPLKFCLYLLPMSAILKYHKIGYHVYADDTQLYISFKCKQPLEAISKVNSCLSDIRRWMITNKLKINDSKTEFIVFRFPQLRCDFSGLSVNVGESQITQSLKVRDLGVTFDNFSTLMIILLLYVEAHIFILEIFEKLGIYNRIMLVLLSFMHLFVVD